VLVAAVGAEEPDAAFVQHLKDVGPVGEPAVVGVGAGQPGAADAQPVGEQVTRARHLVARPLETAAHDQLGAASVPLHERLQRQVGIGVLLDVEQRVVDQLAKGVDGPFKRLPQHEQRRRHALLPVELGGALQERPGDFGLEVLDVVAEQKGRHGAVQPIPSAT
jgi:hypothetical protein